MPVTDLVTVDPQQHTHASKRTDVKGNFLDSDCTQPQSRSSFTAPSCKAACTKVKSIRYCGLEYNNHMHSVGPLFPHCKVSKYASNMYDMTRPSCSVAQMVEVWDEHRLMYPSVLRRITSNCQILRSSSPVSTD